MSGKVKLEDITGEGPKARSSAAILKNEGNSPDSPQMRLTDRAFVDDLSSKAAIGILCVFGLAAVNTFLGVSVLLAGVASSWLIVIAAVPFLIIASIYGLLGFFMLKKSRTAAIIAFGLYFLNIIYGVWQMMEQGNVSGLGLLVNFAVLGGIGAGVEGIHSYHRRHESLKASGLADDSPAAIAVGKIFE